MANVLSKGGINDQAGDVSDCYAKSSENPTTKTLLNSDAN